MGEAGASAAEWRPKDGLSEGALYGYAFLLVTVDKDIHLRVEGGAPRWPSGSSTPYRKGIISVAQSPNYLNHVLDRKTRCARALGRRL
jgi:hypothetical protein